MIKHIAKTISRRLRLLDCFRYEQLHKVNWLFGSIKVTTTNSLKTRDGSELYIRSEDLFTFNEVFVEAEYMRLLKVGTSLNLIVDAGANVGFATRWFLTHWPTAKVLAFEPIQSNFLQLVSNTDRYSSVICHNFGLAAQARSTVFRSNGGGSCEDQLEGTERVQLRDIFDQLDNLTISLLKMDIEGEEKNIIYDPRFNQLMSRVRVLVVELHGTAELRDSLVLTLESVSVAHEKRVIRDRVIFDNAELVWVY
jgi:FkbM family methyltransferase